MLRYIIALARDYAPSGRTKADHIAGHVAGVAASGARPRGSRIMATTTRGQRTKGDTHVTNRVQARLLRYTAERPRGGRFYGLASQAFFARAMRAARAA